jgi:hypothetical protein
MQTQMNNVEMDTIEGNNPSFLQVNIWCVTFQPLVHVLITRKNIQNIVNLQNFNN